WTAARTPGTRPGTPLSSGSRSRGSCGADGRTPRTAGRRGTARGRGSLLRRRALGPGSRAMGWSRTQLLRSVRCPGPGWRPAHAATVAGVTPVIAEVGEMSPPALRCGALRGVPRTGSSSAAEAARAGHVLEPRVVALEGDRDRSEEHTSELQSRFDLV